MGQTAIITGAGQGIGEAAAYRLANDGFNIAVADINEETVTQVAQNLRDQGFQAQAYVLDVADRQAVFNLVEEAVNDLGELGVFINNAGVAFIDSIIDSDPEKISRLFDVNLKGTYWGIQAAAEKFKQQGHGGHIISAASLAGIEASALQSAYSASKFVIRGLTQSAAKEVAADQITVNAYFRGIVRTPLRDGIDARTAQIKGLPVSQQRANSLTEIRLGREATPEDVSEIISWFASPSAAYITGQSLLVDGGMHLS